MKKKLAGLLLSLVLSVQASFAQYYPPSGGGGSPAAASPFAPAGFANVTAFSSWNDLATDGTYFYIDGILASNSHGAITKVKIADGKVAATLDLGAGVSPQGIAVQGGHFYAYDATAGLTGWYGSTSGMSLTRTDTLSIAVATSSKQQWDLSPDGTKYAYVDGNLGNVYEIATATGVVTTVPVGQSSGGEGAVAVGWYNGSSANFYVAYIGVATVDLYSAGTYTSSIATGAGGVPRFYAIRSGINASFFIADWQNNAEIVRVAGGAPSLYLIPNNTPSHLEIATNALSPVAINDGMDVCFVNTHSSVLGQMFFNITYYGASSPQAFLLNLYDEAAKGVAVLPDSSGRIATLSGSGSGGLEVWTVPFYSFYPFSAPGLTGSAALSSGTATVNCVPCTTASVIDVIDTNATPHAIGVTTKNSGSFVVTGTGTDTFDWVLIKP